MLREAQIRSLPSDSSLFGIDLKIALIVIFRLSSGCGEEAVRVTNLQTKHGEPGTKGRSTPLALFVQA